MTSTKKIKNPSTSQTSQHLVAANVWSCPAAHLNVHVESESVYHFIPLFLFTQSSAMSLHQGLIHPSCPVMLFVRTGLMAFGLEGQQRRSPDEANVSPRPLFGSLLWVLLHADGCFGPYCFTGKHSRPPLCQSTDSTNKTPQVLLVVCCNPVQLWFHLPAPPVNRHFFPS